MPKVVPLFKDAVQPLADNAYSFRETSKAQFAIEIQSKINFMADRLFPEERKILGGLPDLKCATPLADILFVFLEEQCSISSAGEAPGETMPQKMIEAMASEKLFYNPVLRMTNEKHELKPSSKILALCVLDKLLTLRKYQDLKTPEVCRGMAALLIEESANFIHCTMGARRNSANFAWCMADFAPKLVGRSIIGQGNNPRNIGHHLVQILGGAVKLEERSPGAEPVLPS